MKVKFIIKAALVLLPLLLSGTARGEGHTLQFMPAGFLAAGNVGSYPNASVGNTAPTNQDGLSIISSAVGYIAAGQAIPVIYSGGYTNADKVVVKTTLPKNAYGYDSIQLYVEKSLANGNTCAPSPGWDPYGTQEVTSNQVEETVPLEDGYCYSFKWEVVDLDNNIPALPRHTYQSTPGDLLLVDRASPTLSIVNEVRSDKLHLQVDGSDNSSGLTLKYRLNGADPVPFTGTELVLTPLMDGMNWVQIVATDQAGNETVRDLYPVADLSPTQIIIQNPRAGQVYGSDLSLIYTPTKPVSDVHVTVDGVARGDLNGLADGSHHLVVSGKDNNNALVSAEVTFAVQQTHFSLTLLSPQTRKYDTTTISAAYESNLPLKRVWMELDGVTQPEGMVLTGLAEGAHALTLHGETTEGATATDTCEFTVEQLAPTLKLISPVQGQIFPTGEVQVRFQNDNPVTYEVHGQQGAITSGETITLTESGDYTMTLTSTSASGKTETETVSFTVDLTTPTLELQSPRPIVYGQQDIPIDYTSDKPLASIQMTLDGKPVASLFALSDGSHAFQLQAQDSAGHVVNKTVNFTVTRLRIVSPSDNEVVAVDSLPPHLPLVYDGSTNFNYLTTSFDNTQPQFFYAAPGTISHLRTSQGRHEVRLSGYKNGSVISDKKSFEIGIMDVAADNDSINYTFTNCNAAFECDVDVTLKVWNRGYYNVETPIELRFDHLRPDGTLGSETQIVSLDSLAVGQSGATILSAFRASLEDKFYLTVDPHGILGIEDKGNNTFAIPFRPGQINSIKTLLPQENTYLSGVSVLNALNVQTAGDVSRIEVKAGSTTFVDDSPYGGNQWNITVDMGLLAPGDNCTQITAYNSDDLAIDGAQHCFEMKRLAIDNFVGYMFPWHEIYNNNNSGLQLKDMQPSENRIVMKDLTEEKVAATESLATKNTLENNKVSAIPTLRDNGKVEYTLVVDTTPSAASAPTIERASKPPFAGSWGEFGVNGIFYTNIDPKQGCVPAGSLIFPSQKSKDDYLEGVYELEFDAMTEEDVSKLQGSFEEAIDKISDAQATFFDITAFAGHKHLGSGLSAYWAGLASSSFKSPTVTVAISPSDNLSVETFNSGGCFVDADNIVPNIAAKISAKVSPTVTVNVSADMGNASVAGGGVLAWGPIPLGVALGFVSVDGSSVSSSAVVATPLAIGFVDADIKSYDQKLNINSNILLNAEMHVKGNSLRDDVVATGSLHADMFMYHHQLASKATVNAIVWEPWAVIGFGSSKSKVKHWLTIRALATVDVRSAEEDEHYQYEHFSTSTSFITEKRKTKECVAFVICHKHEKIRKLGEDGEYKGKQYAPIEGFTMFTSLLDPNNPNTFYHANNYNGNYIFQASGPRVYW